MIPHFEKRHKGGEDAFTVSDSMMAVADGVGGWARHGVDPGLFSKRLTTDIQSFYDHGNRRSLKDILINAVAVNKEVGTSTVTLVALDRDQPNLLSTTNYGDSGYVIFTPSLQ